MLDFLRRILLLALVIAGAVGVRAYLGRTGGLFTGGLFSGPWHEQVARRLAVQSRGVWKAQEPRGETGRLGRPRRVTVHHAGGAAYSRTAAGDVAVTLRALQREHQEGRGWVDLGYHYIVDPVGRVWEGRSARSVGAHAGPGGLNERNVGVLLLGNFDVQRPPAAQLEALERVLDTLVETCGIPAEAVQGHDEVRRGGGFSGTRCPGRHLEPRIAAWRASRAAARPVVAAGAGS